MASLALHLLTVSLGVFFIFLGQLHITGQFFPEIHSQIRNEFGKFNKEFPFHRQTGWRPYAKDYRLAIGIMQVISGILLLFGGDMVKTSASLTLLGILTNMTITFQKLNYNVEYTVSAIGLSLLLILRLVLASKSTGKRVQSSKSSSKKKSEKKTE